MKRAIIPVATMLAVQVMVSLSVLSLSVMMPAVARDLAIDPKLVGVFTAITYAVAATVALASAGPILRLGAVRVCQGALLMAAVGLALNASATLVATVAAVAFIGVAQGPINPASTHILTQRVPRDWYSFVFSVKQWPPGRCCWPRWRWNPCAPALTSALPGPALPQASGARCAS